MREILATIFFALKSAPCLSRDAANDYRQTPSVKQADARSAAFRHVTPLPEEVLSDEMDGRAKSGQAYP
jgi:hypothetical protein